MPGTDPDPEGGRPPAVDLIAAQRRRGSSRRTIAARCAPIQPLVLPTVERDDLEAECLY